MVKAANKVFPLDKKLLFGYNYIIGGVCPLYTSDTAAKVLSVKGVFMENKNLRKSKLREKNIIATIIVMIAVITLSIYTYVRINKITVNRSLERMNEAVNTVTSDISSKLALDSTILNSLAEIIAAQEDIDNKDSLRSIMENIAPLTTAKNIYLLLPDNSIISSSGRSVDIDTDIKLDFDYEVSLGEHVTDRTVSISDPDRFVIRHFVPVMKGSDTIAMLYATTVLDEFPDALNLNNIYNSTASFYIIDRHNGDFLMDTFHTDRKLGSIMDYYDKKTKGKKTLKDAAEEIMEGKAGYVQIYTESLGEYLYFYYSPIYESQWQQLGESKDLNRWTIGITVPESEAIASAFKIRKICIMIAAAEIVIFVLYFIWVLRNTTATMEKAILEERLVKAENAERAKTMFLSNMSHDIRTPMNAIIGYTTLAAGNVEDTARVKDYLSKILSSSNHLLSLINDILDMSRIESGRVDIEETACSFPDILHDLRNILLNQMHSKKLNFYIDTIDVINEDIYCDKLHLNQVLLNLLSNAVKFTPEGGSVFLIIKQLNGAPKDYAAYEITVKDTGIGMDPEFVQHVFEPFERESTSTVSGIQGTGLGMAIAKNIVDMMGGTITVHSEQGKGTEYVLDLEFRIQADKKQVEVIKELLGMRALVVDDDFTICDSVTKMLVQLGLRADWTMSGKEAVLHARQAKELADEFKAYIIDLYLPDVGGLDVVRQIRGEIGENIPIIILTAYDWTTVEHEAREAGVTAFCNKPIFLSTLRDTLVSAVCENKDLSAEPEKILPEVADNIKGKKLLLVEDNELNREIAIAILTESGFSVDYACDGTEAVEKMKNAVKGDYDLILMDVQMPVMNGYEATKAIRAMSDPDIANIPIIAMTANAFDEDKRSAIASGMNDHVAKPLDMEKLFSVLQKYLS